MNEYITVLFFWSGFTLPSNFIETNLIAIISIFIAHYSEREVYFGIIF